MSLASEGGGSDVWQKAVSMLASPSARTAAVAIVASGIGLVALTMRDRRRPPKVPDKDSLSDYQQGGAQEKRQERARSRSDYSSTSLADSKNSVAIFWDVDNCAPPTGASGHTVAQAIRAAAQAAAKHINKSESNISIVSFKAYLELTTEGAQPSASRVLLHSELQGSGVSLIDTPKSGRKDVADKMMITDLLSFAIDKRPPALIVLLSGDRDFAYPLGILRNRGYEILLVVPPVGATPILEASANHVMKWRQDVLRIERDAHGKLYDKAARALESSGGGRVTTSLTAAKDIDTGSVKASKASLSKATATPLARTESLKGPGAPPVPAIFHSLVRVLEQLLKEGNKRPLRSMCAVRLQNLDAKVYQKAGATSWSDFAAVAEAAGIITLGGGGKPGTEFVALRSIPDETAMNGHATISPSSIAPSKQQEQGAVRDDISIFHPLVEVYKSVKAGLPKNEYPTVAQMTTQLTKMSEMGLRDAYAQAGVATFHEYMELAEQAKVGRLVKSDTYPPQRVVHLHPKYATLHTGVITPSGDDAKFNDTSKTNVSISTPSKRVGKEDKESMTKVSDTPAPIEKSNGERSALFHAHQPSGEKIHVSYFPLCNLLLTQRAEGKMASAEGFVQGVLSKHPKIAHFVTSPEQFAAYLTRAERDKIVTLDGKPGKRFLRLDRRLAVGEEEHQKKRQQAAAASSTSDVESEVVSQRKPIDPDSFDRSQSGKREGAGGGAGSSDGSISPSFATETATAQERVKFKPIVEVLVALRRDSPESNVQPQLSKVSNALVLNYPIDGLVLSPGAWIQKQGFSSFLEYYQSAQRKGFIHIVKPSNNTTATSNGPDSKERVRLAEKYETMFFH